MKRYTLQVLGATSGQTIAGATVTILLSGTTTKATLYTTNSKAGPLKSNPFTSDDGDDFFYVIDGTYDILVQRGTRSVLLQDQEIYDLDELSASVISSYTVDALPVLAATAIVLAYVKDAFASDGGVGAMAYWNGSSWKRLTDNGPISAAYQNGLTFLGVGDSLMAGAYVTSNFLDLAATAFGKPAINRGYWGNSWNVDWPGTGDGTPAANHVGTLIQNVPADTAALAAVSGSAKKVIAFAGRNGLATANNHSAATEYADFLTWLAAMNAAGVPSSSIMVGTALPAVDLDEAKRTAYNNLLIAGATSLGYDLIRFDLDPLIGLAGSDSNSIYYLPDRVHLTNAGQFRAATIVLAKFNRVLPPQVLLPVNRAGTVVTNIGVDGFEIVKSGGTAAWDASANDLNPILGDFIYRYTPQQNTADLIVGISTNPAASNSFEGIETNLYFRANGSVSGTASSPSYAAGDHYFISRKNTTITIAKGGTDGVNGITTLLNFNSTSTWYFDTSLFTTGAKVRVKRLQ